MKTGIVLCLVVSALFPQAHAFEEGAEPMSGGREGVQVDFSDPSRFLDIDLDGVGAEKGRQIVLDKVREVFVIEAQKYLPSGFSLNVHVRDIDLAGGFERWRPGQSQVRIDREIYPPRIEFEYKIFDRSGRLVTFGEEYIYNLTYLSDPNGEEYRSKEVAYEVSMLIRNWMKGTLARKVNERVS